MPGVRRLVAKQEDEKFGADYRARENQLRLASGAWFDPPSCWRESRAAGVARSAFSRRGVAPEQANASDPLKLGSHDSRMCGRLIGGVMPHRNQRGRT
jgi:hypothetical protein